MSAIKGEQLGVRMDKDLNGIFYVIMTVEFQDKHDRQKEVTFALNVEEAGQFSKIIDEHIRMCIEKNSAKVN